MAEVIEPQPDDELVFAPQDLGRDRAPDAAPVVDDLGFAMAPRWEVDPAVGNGQAGSFVPGGRDALPPPQPVPVAPLGSRPLSVADGFLIREAEAVAPAAPVDALVVGAPLRSPDPSTGSTTAPAGLLPGFRLDTTTSGLPLNPSAEPPWLERDPTPKPAPSVSRRGWATRHSDLVDRSAHATMLRLREEAVDVSWKAAWIAAISADRRLFRKQDL